MSNIEDFICDCYNLQYGYKLKRYYIDFNPGLQQNKWLSNTQDFDLNEWSTKKLIVQFTSKTNTDDIAIQKSGSLLVSHSFRDLYHRKAVKKNNNTINQDKDDNNLLAFAGPEQIVYEGSKVFLEGITLPINQKLIWKQIGGPKVDLKYESKEDEITKIKNPYFKAPYITLDFDNDTNKNIKDSNNGDKIKPYTKLSFELIAKDQTETRSSLPSIINIIVKMVQRALVFQGGGSLGAYEAGVFKALCEHIVEGDDKSKARKNRPIFDIIAGSQLELSMQL